MDDDKKIVIASFLTTNEDYLILVKWTKAGWHTIEQDGVKTFVNGEFNEYVVAYTWHPETINDGGSWCCGSYHNDIESAFDEYLNKFRRERNKY